MKRTLISLAVAVLPILALPATAHATVSCPKNAPGANLVVSQADGDILVGSSTVVDCFVVLNNDVTVYTNGMSPNPLDGLSNIADQVFVGNQSTPVSGAIIHADVYSDGVTPVPPVDMDWSISATYVVLSNTTNTVFYGSPNRDYVGDAYLPNTDLVIHGNDGDDFLDEDSGVNTVFDGGNGNDIVQLNTATGSVTLSGNDGNDQLVDWYAQTQATTTLLATRSISSAVLKGGRGNDHLKALRHSDVIYAGRGHDVCRIVKRVETHGCEKIVHV